MNVKCSETSFGTKYQMNNHGRLYSPADVRGSG